MIPGEANGNAQLVRDGPGPAYLVLTFPPQHLAEEAYFTTVEGYQVAPPPPPNLPEPQPPDDDAGRETGDELGDIPIDVRLAGWSTLAFIVRDNQLPIDWTLEGLLLALPGLELSVAPNALPPRNPPRWLDPLLPGTVQEVTLTTAALAAGIGSIGDGGADGGLGDASATSIVATLIGRATRAGAGSRRASAGGASRELARARRSAMPSACPRPPAATRSPISTGGSSARSGSRPSCSARSRDRPPRTRRRWSCPTGSSFRQTATERGSIPSAPSARSSPATPSCGTRDSACAAPTAPWSTGPTRCGRCARSGPRTCGSRRPPCRASWSNSDPVQR